MLFDTGLIIFSFWKNKENIRNWLVFCYFLNFIAQKKTFTFKRKNNSSTLSFEDKLKNASQSELFPYQKWEKPFIVSKENNYFLAIEILGQEIDFLGQDQQLEKTNLLKKFFYLTDKNFTLVKVNQKVDLSKNSKFLKQITTASNKNLISPQLETNQKIEHENYETRYFLVFSSEKKNYLHKIIGEHIKLLEQLNLKPQICFETEWEIIFQKLFFANKNDELISNNINFQSDKVKTGKKLTTILTVSHYPKFVSFGWLKEILNFSTVTTTIQVRELKRTNTIKEINQALSDLEYNLLDLNANETSEGQDTEFQKEKLEELLFQLQTENEKVKILTVNFLITADKKRELIWKKNQLNDVLTALDFEFSNNTYRQLTSFLNYFPQIRDKGENIRKNEQIIPLTTLAASFSFTYQNLTDEKGFLLGQISNKGYLIFDINKIDRERSNSNMFIIGTSGKGKSFTIKKIISQLLLKNQKVFILDPEKEYQKLASHFKGNLIDCSGNSFTKINPLQIFSSFEGEESTDKVDVFSSHIQFLEQFFEITCPEMTELQKIKLTKFIENFYKEKKLTTNSKNFPTFSELKEFILSETVNVIDNDLKIIRLYLDRFTGTNGNLWNYPTNINLNKNLTVFNFNKLVLSGNQRIINAQMFLILKLLENEISLFRDKNENRKLTVVVDEAHLLIDKNNPIALNLLYQQSKRIRKYNGNIIVITQNINDFVGDETIKKYSTAIINNCQYSMFFKLNPGDINDLNKLLRTNKLTDKESEELAILLTGNCLFKLEKQRFFLKVLASEKELEMFKT